jgi:hypothetical protein
MASVTSRMEAALGPITKLASGRITPRQAVIQLEAEFNRQSTLRVPPELVDQETILVN